MTRILIGMLFVFGCGTSFGQTALQVFTETILGNNLMLSEQELHNQIKTLDRKISSLPKDPEIGFAHLWGSPSFIGQRKDLSLSQQIKFPSYYFVRNHQNSALNQLDLQELEILQNEILTHTFRVLIDWQSVRDQLDLHQNRLARWTDASHLAKLQNEAGEVSELAYEKLLLFKVAAEQQMSALHSSEQLLRLKMQALNAMEKMDLSTDLIVEFDKIMLVDQLGYENAVSQKAKLVREVGKMEPKVAKQSLLPNLHFAYMQEAIPQEKFSGVELGLSIPIWGKGKGLKRAKLNQQSLDLQADQLMQQTELNQKLSFEKWNQAIRLEEVYEDLLNGLKTPEILLKSYELGEISLKEYLLEVPFQYQAEDQLLEARRQRRIAALEMNQLRLKTVLGL